MSVYCSTSLHTQNDLLMTNLTEFYKKEETCRDNDACNKWRIENIIKDSGLVCN